jgi:disulfide bond formation protein DsbB
MALLGLTPRQSLLAIAALAIAGVAAALVGQYGFDMRPCPWCILQRVVFVVIALLCLVGAALPSRPGQRAAAAGVVLLAAAGSAAALWQHFVAAKSSSCALTFADRLLGALRVESMSPALFGITGSCADAKVDLVGVPFEFWSLALFVVLAALALPALRHAR